MGMLFEMRACRFFLRSWGMAPSWNFEPVVKACSHKFHDSGNDKHHLDFVVKGCPITRETNRLAKVWLAFLLFKISQARVGEFL